MMKIKYYEYHPDSDEYFEIEKLQFVNQDAKLEHIEFIFFLPKILEDE